MNANNMKKQKYYLMKYDLRGRSLKVTFYFSTKLYMNANIVKTQKFEKMNYDLKGHWWSNNTTFVFKSFWHT